MQALHPPPGVKRWRVQLVGEPCLMDTDGRPRLLSATDALVLAMLALDGPLSREQLARRLWPESAPDRQRNTLRQRLHRLQRLAPEPLLALGDPLALAAALPVDVHILRDPAAAAPDGDLLAGLRPGTAGLRRWLDDARSQWRHARNRHLHALAQSATTLADPARMYELSQRLLREDPSDEAAHRLLMQACHLRGDHPGGRRAWQACRAALRRRLGAAPDAPTRQLAAQLGLDRARPAGVTPPPRAELPVTLHRPPHLVGRENQIRGLDLALAQRALPVLLGAPGVGKTRLLEHLVSSQGGAVLSRAEPGDARLPYATLRRIVDNVLAARGQVAPAVELLASLAAPTDAPCSARDPARIENAWARAWSAWRAGGLDVLAVDDLQFADPQTTALLLTPRLAPRLVPDDAGSALILAASDSAEPALRALALMRPGHEALLWWRLGPLSDDAAADLIASLGLVAAPSRAAALALARRCAGHPRWLLLTLGAALLSGLEIDVAATGVAPPARVLQDVLARMRGLSASALRLLRVMAVAGADHDIALAARVLDRHPVDLADDLRELEQAFLVHGDGIVFDAVINTTLADLPAVVATELHRRVAEALQLRGDAALPALARHWRLAGEPARSAVQAAMAARRARQAGRPDQALALADAAIEAYGMAGDLDARWTLAIEVMPWAILALPASAVESRLHALASWAHNTTQHCELALASSRHALTVEQPARALVQAERAQTLADDLAQAPLQAAAAAWRGWSLSSLGRMTEASAAFEAWRSWVDRADAHPATQRDFFGACGASEFLGGRTSHALPHLQRAAGLSEQLGDHADAMEQWTNLMVGLTHAGDHGGAMQAGEAAAAAAARAGGPFGVSAMAMNVQLATLHLAAGHYRRVIDLLEAALSWSVPLGAGGWRVIAEHQMATTWLRLGQPARAQAVLTPLHDGATAGNRLARCRITCRLSLSNRRRAGPTLQAALDEFATTAQFVDLQATRLMLAAEAEAAPGLALCDAILADPLTAGVPGIVTHALARRAWALAQLGQPVAAAAAALLARQAFAVAPPTDLDKVSWCALVASAAGEIGAGTSLWAVQTAAAWLASARPWVPVPFVDSFIHRQTANAAMARRAVDAGLLPQPWFQASHGLAATDDEV